MPEIQHGLDPMKSLGIHALFNELRAALAATPNYFSLLLRKYFIDNPHFVEITMTPSTTKEEEEVAEEKGCLKSKEELLSPKDKEEIVSQTDALKKLQDETQDLSCLPMLHLPEVPRPCRKIALHQEKIGSVELFSHTPFTNDVCYTSLITPLPNIEKEDLWLLRLFSLVYTQLGCGNKSYRETLDYLQAYTGGVYASVSLTPQAANPHEIIPSWVMRGKALSRNLEKLFSIFSDFILSPRLDERKRVREIIEKQHIDLHNALQAMALDYAMSKAVAPLTPAQAVLEELYGLSYYKNLKELISSYATQEKWLFEKLGEISSKVLHTSEMQAVFCGSPEDLLQLKESNLFGLAELTEKPFKRWSSPEILPRKEDLVYFLPSKVSFTALALSTVPYAHPDAPKLCLLSALMNNTYLHKRLREQGGAYGGGASAQTTSGTFSFYSYRDPNLFSTLQAYEASLRWIEQGTFTEENLEEAKLSILQDLDSPIAPGSRAEVAYFWRLQGKTESMRQRFKDLVRETTKQELQALIPLYFQGGVQDKPFVAFTSRELAVKDIPLFAKIGRKIIKKQV
jgi:Zn-dependent M16 (insulinase) family peptidase